MDALEAKFKCLELAVAHARNIGRYADTDVVVEISTRFYNHITQGGEDVSTHTEPEQPPKRKTKADKPSEIFK